MPFIVEHDRLEELTPGEVKIRVVAAGAFGSAAQNGMLELQRDGVEFISVNTDRRALLESKAAVKLQLGMLADGEREHAVPRHAKTEQGPQVTEEERRSIAERFRGAHAVVIVAGMGKDPGAQCAPQLALIAKNMGILTLAVATTPFECEGTASVAAALRGTAELRKYADTLILLDNDRALPENAGGVGVTAAFELAGAFLSDTAGALVDILTNRGHIRPGFGEVAELLSKGGEALIATTRATGEESALHAVDEAMRTVLRENSARRHAEGIIVNVTGNVEMGDFSRAMRRIKEQFHPETKLVNSYVDEGKAAGETRATLIVAGLKKIPGEPEKAPAGPVDYAVPAFVRRNIPIEPPRTSPRKNATAQ